MPLANHDAHHNDLRLDIDVIAVSALSRVLVALLVQRLPVKHECDVPFVQQVEEDDLSPELTSSGQVVAVIVRVLVPQRARM